MVSVTTCLQNIHFFESTEILILILTDLTSVFASTDAQSGKNCTVLFNCSELEIDWVLIFKL